MQFAQVEQQLRQNEQLATLVSIEKAAQATTALAYVGQTVAVDGTTAALADNQATWSFQSPKPVNATITIKSATGQTVYSGSFAMNAGAQSFTWDGRDNAGVKWPDGNYTLSVAAKDASGQAVSIPSEVQGVVDSVDLTKTPPVLSIGGQTFTIDKIKRVVRPGRHVFEFQLPPNPTARPSPCCDAGRRVRGARRADAILVNEFERFGCRDTGLSARIRQSFPNCTGVLR